MPLVLLVIATELADYDRINKLNACTLVDELHELVALEEEVVAHNTRAYANVQNATLKAHLVCEACDILAHYLAPKLG
jgi:hypothetical protein